jgi:hypothetical protein
MTRSSYKIAVISNQSILGTVVMNSEAELAKAAAEALSGTYGQNLIVAVEKAAAGNAPKTDFPADRDILTNLNTTASILQIAWFVIEVSRFCWRKFQSLKDKAALAKAAKQEIRPVAGMTGEQRDSVIEAVVQKL